MITTYPCGYDAKGIKCWVSQTHNNLEIEDLHLDKLFTDDYQHANHNKVRDANALVTHDSVDSEVGQELPVPTTTRSGR